MATIRCKHCDAEVYWDVQAGALKCEYCGKITNPEDYNFNTMSEEEGIDYSHTTYKCNHCGALLVVGDKKMTSQCAYCGSALVLHDKNDKHFNPKFVIPFKITDTPTNEFVGFLAST